MTDIPLQAIIDHDIYRLLFGAPELVWQEGRVDHVEGDRVWHPKGWYDESGKPYPHHFSSDAGQARKVVQRLLELGWQVTITLCPPDADTPHSHCYVELIGSASRVHRADGEHEADTICRAAIGALTNAGDKKAAQ